jgi:hypothetical protein
LLLLSLPLLPLLLVGVLVAGVRILRRTRLRATEEVGLLGILVLLGLLPWDRLLPEDRLRLRRLVDLGLLEARGRDERLPGRLLAQ